jgi:hypothetical protein
MTGRGIELKAGTQTENGKVNRKENWKEKSLKIR